MKLINLTPHAITFRDSAHRQFTIPASGKVARLETVAEFHPGNVLADMESSHITCCAVSGIMGFGLWTTQTKAITNLPDPTDGVLYIVSMPVAQACDREDVIAPDQGDSCVRENGKIVAVTRFTKYSKSA